MSPQDTMLQFFEMLGHTNLGVTELLALRDEGAWVAYAVSPANAVRLCLGMDRKAKGIYAGAHPRPVRLYDLAPDCWKAARAGCHANCAKDANIEYLTVALWDIDVVSPGRKAGHPASEEELESAFLASRLLARQEGLALNSVIVCTGNGCQVWAPMVPLAVETDELAARFKAFCEQRALRIANKVKGVRIDSVYNPSRLARVPGTWNLKGVPTPDRPHRRAYFTDEPISARSLALHHMVLNTEISPVVRHEESLRSGLRCDLDGIESCECVQYCREHPRDVSEPLWWGLLTSLVYLEGGIPLAHEISKLDGLRYDYARTQRLLERILRERYKPVSCRTLVSPATVRPGRGVFQCSRMGTCPARAPIYLTVIRTDNQRKGVATMSTDKNAPMKSFTRNDIKAAIWCAPKVQGDAVAEGSSIKIDRSYREGEKRKYTTMLRPQDLVDVAIVAMEAYRFLVACATDSDAHERKE